MKFQINENRKEIQYAKKIISGEYLSCEAELLACKRFMRDLERQNDDDFPYCYDTTRADRFFKFYEICPNPDIQGKLLKLSEFQYFDYGNIYGWVDKKTGIRRFTKAFDWKARGNYKSTGAAVVCLNTMANDPYYPPYHPELKVYEDSPNVVVLAVDYEQTKEVRGVAVKMVRRSPKLQKYIAVGKGNNKSTYIKSRIRDGEMIAISGELGKQDGGKPNLIVRDEAAAHKEEDRFNTLCGGQGKKAQSLALSISTAGDDAMNKPVKSEYDRCIEILHGRIIDEEYFIIIRELEEKDDPADFSLYEKCSPVFREHSEYSERLLKQVKSEYDRAFNGGTEKQKIEYLIKRTNRWQVGSEHKFLTQEELDMLVASQVPRKEFLKLIQNKPNVTGLDASLSVDLSSDSFVFNLPDGKIGIDAYGFMAKESLYLHLKKDKLPYESYARDGCLIFTNGMVIDLNEVTNHIVKYENTNSSDIKGICADRAFLQQFLITMSEGRTPNGKSYEVIECPQTTAILNEACINFKKWLLAGKLIVCENPFFIQHCANAYVEYDKGGRMKVAKKNKDSSYRIDLLAATLNAIRKIDLLESENLYNAIMSGSFSF